ncbi:MAG: metallophosphoesterase [Bacteroidales bacterium]|jgi:hypothetical protein|nr:metallophosphoesterase [Bacteroidales bacterium]
MTTRRNFVKKAGAGLLGIGVTPALYGFSVQEQTLGLQPYLQNPATNAMTIMWRTADLSYSWIEYGTDKNDLKIARTVENGIVAANITKHKVRITGLTPDTQYFYRVCSQKVIKYQAYSKELGPVEKSDFFSFTTLGTIPKDFTCLIFTDLHDNLALFDKLMGQVRSHGIEYDFSIFNGDIFNDPASESQILNLVTRYNQGVDAANKPAFYLRGNHEIRGPYAMEWQSFFDFTDDKTYLSFSYGDTRFVLLDNGEDKNDGHIEYSGLVDFDGFRNQQTDWLKKELATDEFQNAFRKILVHHIPIYSWNSGHDPGFMPCFDLWDPIFRTTPFDLDITGHLHNFKFYSKNTVNNPFPLVVGGGNTEANGRVMVLIKRGEVLTLKSLDCAGNITVHPIYRENVSLSSVTIVGGELIPAFDPQQTEYQIGIPSQISVLSVTGQSSGGTATVKGNVTDKTCTIGEKIVLTVTADDGTEKLYTFTLVLGTTGVNSPESLPTDVQVYPNPLKQGSILHANLDKHYNDITIKILNETGTIVQTNRMQGQYLSIPLALQQGAYIINLNTGQKEIAHKILIQ